MSSRIETFCILLLCLFGMCCSGTGVEHQPSTTTSGVVLRIPGLPIGVEMRAVVGDVTPSE
jgi:hypothetical protein